MPDAPRTPTWLRDRLLREIVGPVTEGWSEPRCLINPDHQMRIRHDDEFWWGCPTCAVGGHDLREFVIRFASPQRWDEIVAAARRTSDSMGRVLSRLPGAQARGEHGMWVAPCPVCAEELLVLDMADQAVLSCSSWCEQGQVLEALGLTAADLDDPRAREWIQDMREASAPPPEKTSDGYELELICLADVEEEEVEWLWRPYIPLGELTLFAGDGKLGKSKVSAAIAAAVSVGHPLERVSQPGRHHPTREPADVVILSAEDSPSKVIRRRFRLLGADVRRIHMPRLVKQGEEKVITLQDVRMLDVLLRRVRPALLVVDPVQSYLGPDVDAHRVNEVRPILDAVALLAQRYGCAVLVVAHFSKGDGPLRKRVQGSTDFVNRCRSILIGGKTEDGQRVVLHESCNFDAEGPALGYELNSERELEWSGPVDVTELDLYVEPARGGAKGPDKVEAAAAWLQELLQEKGPLPSREVRRAARGTGHSAYALKQARVLICDPPSQVITKGGQTDSLWALDGTTPEKPGQQGLFDK